jgi:hypothetical protein
MRSGDHICVDRGTFMDHGIYVSREQVIHISAGPLKDSKRLRHLQRNAGRLRAGRLEQMGRCR